MGRKSKMQIQREKELVLMKKKKNEFLPLKLLAIDIKTVKVGSGAKKTVGFIVHPYKKGHVLKRDFGEGVNFEEAMEQMRFEKETLVLEQRKIKADISPEERMSEVNKARRGRGKVEGYEYHDYDGEEEEE